MSEKSKIEVELQGLDYAIPYTQTIKLEGLGIAKKIKMGSKKNEQNKI